MEKNPQLQMAWDFVEHTGKSIFLTGKAGTGKTTFLKTVVERSRKRSIVVAPTGVAAINAGGATIHSFFQLPLSPFVPDAKVKTRFDFKREKRRIIASLDLLIIDEISMVRSDLLDAIDTVLRRFRHHYLPFGGVQLLMIGDLQQLTPVMTAEDRQMLAPYYDTPYFFGSKALAQTDYVTIQLDRVYRQQDTHFVDLLNNIREGRATDGDLATLNRRYQPSFHPTPEQDYILLTTHNRYADQYNESELQRLGTRPYTFRAEIDGTFPEYNYPTSDVLQLKVGTQVMFVKNDTSADHLYYNGRIGKVTDLKSGQILVRCPGDAKDIVVERATWENTTYTLNEQTKEIEAEVKGTFKQYPLRLAWAITVHKSQGLTFDHAIIDASQSFAPGQAYVALSRCRTLEGMVLSSPLSRRAIINDATVDRYITAQEHHAEQSIGQLPLLKEAYYQYLLTELFDFSEVMQLQRQMVRLFVEYFSRSHASLEMLHKQALEKLDKQVSTVASKWVGLIRQSSPDPLHGDAFLTRTRNSADYFARQLDDALLRPISLTKQVKSANKEATRRLNNLLPELTQVWKAKTALLRKVAEEGFAVGHYLREKQLTLLDAMSETESQRKRQTRGTRKY